MTFANHLEEVLKLVAETGDRCIVLRDGNEPFVVMDLQNYRTLLKDAAGKQDLSKLSERELLDKINQDIAEWRELRQDELAEYELSQFRVDTPQPKMPAPATQQSTQVQASVPAYKAQNRPTVNLPVVDDINPEEYRLEPL